eukprot:UN02412
MRGGTKKSQKKPTLLHHITWGKEDQIRINCITHNMAFIIVIINKTNGSICKSICV